MAGGVYLEIDASELNGEIAYLRSVLTPEQVDTVMNRVFRRTGSHVRQILKKDLPKEYHVKAGEVGAAVGNARVSGGGGIGVGCTIPIKGARKSIGGSFSASGGAHGWNALRGKKYKVKSRIVRAQQSKLPDRMTSYGGEPPFRNLGSTLGGVAFTRAGKDRLPIMKVSGIAVPQMPMNRSKEDVQEDIVNYMRGRIEHEFQHLIAGG